MAAAQISLTETREQTADRVIRAVVSGPAPTTRRVVAIAGPPASGKSTLAETVQARLNARGYPCGLVAMDGFHLDNDTLRERDLLGRKGAPETFDVDGFDSLLTAVRSCPDVDVPIFDRARDRVVLGARKLLAEQRWVIVEGNYLFLDAPKWRDLCRHWDFGVFVSPPLELLRKRLVQRWLDHGLSASDAEQRTRDNDLENARLVLDKSDTRDVQLRIP